MGGDHRCHCGFDGPIGGRQLMPSAMRLQTPPGSSNARVSAEPAPGAADPPSGQRGTAFECPGTTFGCARNRLRVTPESTFECARNTHSARTRALERAGRPQRSKGDRDVGAALRVPRLRSSTRDRLALTPASRGVPIPLRFGTALDTRSLQLCTDFGEGA